MSVPSAEDIAELQRECHPFPDYIDFIHGRPTSYERLMDVGPRLENGQCGQAALEHTALGTLTVPPDGPDTPTPYQLHRTNSSQYSVPPAPAPTEASYPSPQSINGGPSASVGGHVMVHHGPSARASLRQGLSMLAAGDGSFLSDGPSSPTHRDEVARLRAEVERNVALYHAGQLGSSPPLFTNLTESVPPANQAPIVPPNPSQMKPQPRPQSVSEAIPHHAPSLGARLQQDLSLWYADLKAKLPGRTPANHPAGQATTKPPNLSQTQPQTIPTGAPQSGRSGLPPAPPPYPAQGPPQSAHSGPSLAPPPNAAQNTSSASPVTGSTIRILQRDDLLRLPGYDCIPQQLRVSTNARINHLCDITQNANVPLAARGAAMREVQDISMRVHHKRQEAFYNILYKYMPKIYDNITFIKLYPTGNDVPWRRQELIDFEKQFKGLMWNYMMRLVTEMQKTRLTGAAPYTAIPGWLERWNKVRAERAERERKRTLCRPAQEGEAEQSKGESSPLPQWKGF